MKPIARYLSVLVLALVPALAFAEGVPKQPPVADAGGDRNAYTGIGIILYGSATDPENDPILHWRWFVEVAPPGAVYELYPDDAQTPRFVG